MGKQCLIDFHLHTEHSPDSEAAMPAVCNAAAEAGLSRIAITDHVEIPAFTRTGDRTTALSYAQAGGMQALFREGCRSSAASSSASRSTIWKGRASARHL